MEPRLDSGLAKSTIDPSQEFDILAPLSPEEVCWIMDKALAAEVTWHQGHALSQTVYTCWYFHELPNLRPEVWLRKQLAPIPDDRPAELVTLVLRAWIIAMTKSCDMVWREFGRRHVYENEDVLTDKSELSLLEGTPVTVALDGLRDAIDWLASVPIIWKTELMTRMQLRMRLLRVYAQPVRSNPAEWRQNIRSCRLLLDDLQKATNIPNPPAVSVSRSAFDPAMSRFLINHAPLPVIYPLEVEISREMLSDMLMGLEDTCTLESSVDILAWKEALLIGSRQPTTPRRSAYVRSRTAASFITDTLIFQSHSKEWLVTDILHRTAGIPPHIWDQVAQRGRVSILSARASKGVPIWLSFQGLLCDALISFYTSLSHNRYRQRRTFSKNLKQWGDLLGFSLRLSHQLSDFPVPSEMAKRIVFVVLHFQSLQMTEIILSGFEAELYLPREKPFLYWYLSRIVLACHTSALENLQNHVQSEAGSLAEIPTAHSYVSFQLQSTRALQNMVEATLRGMDTSVLSVPIDRSMEAILRRRLKWAFPDPASTRPQEHLSPPSFDEYESAMHELESVDAKISKARTLDLWKSAKETLTSLQNISPTKRYSQLCEPAFTLFVDRLTALCDKHTLMLQSPQVHSTANHSKSSTEAPAVWFNPT